MSRYTLSAGARQDLTEILRFIAEDSPAAAAKVSKELRRAIERLADFPSLGHRRPDLTQLPLRFWQVYSYYVIYEQDRVPIEIVRILHAARDVPELLGS